jgi:predicted TIM-barrel fold metal-dependent hydrolase
MEALAKQGVRGFRIYPALASGTNWLSGDGMQAMWKYGAEARLNLCPLIDTVELAGVSEMCDKFPDTPVVIDHFARLGIKGEIPESELKTLCAMSRHANVKVKASAFYALGKKKGPYLDLGPMIRRVLDAFGPDRVMWASDGPFQVVDGHNYRESVELIRDRLDFLSASDRDWLLRKTAAETFF